MTVQQIVDFLNTAVAADPVAMANLLRATVQCNKPLGDHPTIICWGPEETHDGSIKVGLGGILMGIAVIDGVGIGSEWSDDLQDLLGFKVVPLDYFANDSTLC